MCWLSVFYKLMANLRGKVPWICRYLVHFPGGFPVVPLCRPHVVPSSVWIIGEKCPRFVGIWFTFRKNGESFSGETAKTCTETCLEFSEKNFKQLLKIESRRWQLPAPAFFFLTLNLTYEKNDPLSPFAKIMPCIQIMHSNHAMHSWSRPKGGISSVTQKLPFWVLLFG